MIKKKTKDNTQKEAVSLLPLIDDNPYYFSPSFFTHNGRVGTVVQLYVRTGSNIHMGFVDVIDLVPTDSMSGIEMFFCVDDMIIKGDEKKRLIQENASGGRDTIKDTIEHGTKEETEQAAAIIMQQAELADYDDYETVIENARPIVGFRVSLIIIGETQEQIEAQLKTLNISLSKSHEGAQWDSLGGEAYNRVVTMFKRYEGSRFDMTSTGENYSGLNFTMSAGLIDARGVPVGVDAMSVTGSNSMFDFDSYLDKQAIIAAPASATVPLYVDDRVTLHPPTLSSVAAQTAANQIVMNGHRAHHIVLNDFDYFLDGLFYRPTETKEIFKKYDVAKTTINPLQGFGDIEQVVPVYNRLVQKIVNIFNVLEDLKLEQDEKAIILNAVQQFYFAQDLWKDNAHLYPKRTRIVGIETPETYPTMGIMLNDFTTLAQRAARDNRELKADKIDTLYSILNQALSSNMGILGSTTSITETRAPQVYYDFENVDTARLKQVQFLNLIEYVIHTALPGDVIVLHGMEKLYKTVASMTLEAIKAAQKNRIRFIFAFDTLTATEDSSVDEFLDVFSMKGLFYQDLDFDVDYSLIGRCLPDEVDKFEAAMNTELSDRIRHSMMRKSQNQVLFHRHRGDVNTFVNMNVII